MVPETYLQSLVKIGSVTAEIFLIWTYFARTNVAWTNVAWTNVTVTVVILLAKAHKPAINVWAQLAQLQLKMWGHWVSVGGWVGFAKQFSGQTQLRLNLRWVELSWALTILLIISSFIYLQGLSLSIILIHPLIFLMVLFTLNLDCLATIDDHMMHSFLNLGPLSPISWAPTSLHYGCPFAWIRHALIMKLF